MSTCFNLKIYSANLISREKECDLHLPINFDSVTQNFVINTHNAQAWDTLIIKDTNLETLTLTSEGQTLVNKQYQQGKKDILESFASAPHQNAELEILKAQLPFFTGSIKAVSSLINLGNTLTTFTKSDNSKRGSFYLNNGEMLSWSEYKKIGGRLVIKNMTPADKEALFEAFDKYTFLNFVFTFKNNNVEIYELALSKINSETFDKRTGFFETDLSLAER
ncbi:hypothetical protein Dip510_001931 [Elusimicrobium posterum]|uniref:hypothetical protein n=1 Tax=Elusimicrobium posterum TaxID=3116653 RepID=UPI003C738500